MAPDRSPIETLDEQNAQITSIRPTIAFNWPSRGYTRSMSASVDALDDPETTSARRALLRQSGYLHELYRYWYRLLIQQLPTVPGQVLELGSGGGFLNDCIPDLRTSDVMLIPGVELVIDARSLPFADASLRAIVGTNVLHHVPEINRFFAEAERKLAPGGRLVFIEPWPTTLSRPVYRFLHHEPFDQKRDWSIPAGGPLTAANGALPWIVFERDRTEFEHRFPRLRVASIDTLMPFSYLLSGGIGRSWPLPARLFNVIERLERPFSCLGLFACIVVERRGDT